MLINQAELLDGVSGGAKAIIEAQSEEVTLREGEMLFKKDEDAEHFYILKEGKVQLYPGNQENLCFLAHDSGAIFGWSALFEPHRHFASARCTTETKIKKVPRQAFEEIMKEHPQDGQLIYRHLAGLIGRKLFQAYQSRLTEVASPAPTYGG